jgi:hypothetical protein
VVLDLLENPIPINYEEVPEFTKEDYEERIGKVNRICEERGYTHLIVYGDREHFSNIHYLSGMDPRFEEALLVLAKGERPKLILGNECMDYAKKVKIDADKILYQPFSLIGQPSDDSRYLEDIFRDCGITASSKLGIVGWKYYDPSKHTLQASILDIPNYIVETLCRITKRENLENAADIFLSNEYGLRNTVSAKEIVHFELNGTKVSRNVYNVLKNLREGMTEMDASQFLNIDGEPASIHPILNFGDFNTSCGIASPSYYKKLNLGDTIGVGMGYRGNLVHKAGVYIRTPDDLTEEQRAVREYFYHTYFESVAAYYENFKIGNTCGDIYDIVDRILGGGKEGGIKKFNIGLNPGHLIHTEEWTNSPFVKNSATPIRSGMLVQCDYTAMHRDPYLVVHIEDGFAVADDKLRDEVKALSPSCFKRIEARRDFIRNVLNVNLPEEILPFSDLQLVFFPYMADTGIILRME